MPVGGFDYLYIALKMASQMKEKPMFDCGYFYAPYPDLKPPPYNMPPFRQTPQENVSYNTTEEQQRVANLAALMTTLPSVEEEECGEPVDWSKEGF